MNPLLSLALLFTLAGCETLVQGTCSNREKVLVEMWHSVKYDDRQHDEGRVQANKFIKEAIEKEVPLRCWRDR